MNSHSGNHSDKSEIKFISWKPNMSNFFILISLLSDNTMISFYSSSISLYLSNNVNFGFINFPQTQVLVQFLCTWQLFNSVIISWQPVHDKPVSFNYYVCSQIVMPIYTCIILCTPPIHQSITFQSINLLINFFFDLKSQTSSN